MTVPAKRCMFIDASGGKRDTFAYMIGGWNLPDDSGRYLRHANGRLRRRCGEPIERPGWRPIGRAHLRIDVVGGFQGAFFSADAGDAIVDRLAADAKQHSVSDVFGDQYESLMLSSAFGKRGLRFVEVPWSGASKPKAVTLIRRWFSEHMIALPEHEQLRRELCAFEERISPSGHFTYDSRGVHADYTACLITAALAELTHGLPRSPMRGGGGVHVGQQPIGLFGGSGGLNLGPGHGELPSAETILQMGRDGQLPKVR